MPRKIRGERDDIQVCRRKTSTSKNFPEEMKRKQHPEERQGCKRELIISKTLPFPRFQVLP